MKKEKLLELGISYVKEFCKINDIKMPKIKINEKTRYCGFYTMGTSIINVNPKLCATEAVKPGFSWSHRHYFVDRTPCGVICHEFGHYLHHIISNSELVIPKDHKITSYEPNYCERFAETIKLFILNPDLLKQYCPNRYKVLVDDLGLHPIIHDSWEELMINNGLNQKYIEAARKRINNVKK